MNIALDKKIDEFLSQNREEIIENLSALVSCPSVRSEAKQNAPFGEGTALALKTALELSGSYGFKTKNADWLYGMATLDGLKNDKCIGIISHLDVVPAGNGWNTPPFEPRRTDKYLIGRGVMDDKSAAALGLAVMKFFSTVERLDSSLLLFFGCCEETDSIDIETFVKNEKQPDFSLVPDTNFPVCHGEKGILGITVKSAVLSSILEFSGGNAQNMVPDIASCKLAFSEAVLSALNASKKDYHEIHSDNSTIAITARGISKHAAMPNGSANAIARLCELLLSSRVLPQGELDILSTVYECASSIYGEPYSLDISDKPSGRLTMINGTARLENGSLVLGYNMRYPVTTNGSEHISALKKYFAKNNMEVLTYKDNAPCYLPADDARVQTLVKIYEDLTGKDVSALKKYFAKNNMEVLTYKDNAPCYLPADDARVQTLVKIYEDLTGKDGTPYTMGGGTYARYMKNAIGFGLESGEEHNPDFPTGHGGIHQPDEALNIEEFIQAIRIYIHTVAELDKVL